MTDIELLALATRIEAGDWMAERVREGDWVIVHTATGTLYPTVERLSLRDAATIIMTSAAADQ